VFARAVQHVLARQLKVGLEIINCGKLQALAQGAAIASKRFWRWGNSSAGGSTLAEQSGR
jgi:hypothetical protein